MLQLGHISPNISRILGELFGLLAGGCFAAARLSSIIVHEPDV